MKTALRFVVILGVICLVMGGGVAALFATFNQRIAEKKREAFQATLRQVLPGVEDTPVAGSPDQGDDVYRATSDGKVVGYAARGQQKGYSSTVKVLVGVEADGRTIRKVAVLEQQETPGLGANVSLMQSNYNLWQKVGVQPPPKDDGGQARPEVTENKFLKQFEGLDVGKVRADVLPMTAATITSDAVGDAVLIAVGRIQKVVGDSPGPDTRQ